MQLEIPHQWPDTLEAAMAVQQQLRSQVITDDQLGDVRFVAGIDCGFEQDGTITRAAVAVLSFPDLAPVDQSIARHPTTMPYVPGFLSFREAPAVLHALRALETTPDLLLCDGQGLAHPRRFGLACHIGLLTGLPAIGVAKTLFVGRHGPLADERGAREPLVDRTEVVGAALRTRPGTRPLFISIGHKISLPTAIDYVMRCTTQYRLPETTRRAHKLASG